MKRTALDSLFAMLDRNVDLVKSTNSICFFRAEYHLGLEKFKEHKLDCIQTYKPAVNTLKNQGFTVRQNPGRQYDVIFYLATRQKEENLYNIARAFSLLTKQGKLICSLENNLGAASLEKKLKELSGPVESFSKNRCRVFYCTKNKRARINENLRIEYLNLGFPKTVEKTNFQSKPGVFSWKKIDQGSELLSESLKSSIKGKVAEFGSGYGYISYKLAEKCPKIDSLDLYEAEKVALDCCQVNLEKFSKPKIKYSWTDLVNEEIPEGYDFIVTNPPFHNGSQSEVELGKKFIRKSARALKKNGKFLMVANKFLPYERELQENFKSFHLINANSGYKVLLANK